MKQRSLAISVLLACLSAGASAHAQPRIVIRDSAECGSCRVTLERAMEIGGPRDSVLLTPNTRFIVTADGRVFASPTATPGVIAVYNSEGDFTGTIGREGRGPGEFTRVWGSTMNGDFLYAIDHGGRRINIFGPTLSFAFDIPLTENFADNDGILIVGSRIVLSSIFQTPNTPGPVVIIAANGARARTVSPEPDSVPTHARRRYLAESLSGRFWVAPFNRYVIELWDTAGRHHSSVVRESDWFRPWSMPTNPTTMLPQTQLKSVQEDAAGRLWVALLVADSRWAPVRPTALSTEPDANRVFDTRIEVLDPRARSVVAHVVTDNALGKVIAAEPMFRSYRVDASGAVIWTLHRARLQGLRKP
jgi:hypothetical protein